MRVGVICEGRGDFAVVRNIVKAALDLDAAHVDPIRPELQTDETSWHEMDPEEFSNWEIVKQECCDGASIATYLDNIIGGRRLVVVQIDTAECELAGYGVKRPSKTSSTYVADCCREVTRKVRSWVRPEYAEYVVPAAAVEETDAWLIPLYDTKLAARKRDTGTIGDPKEHLKRVLQRLKIPKERRALQHYDKLSKPLRKLKELLKAVEHNSSLDLFVRSLHETAERLEPGSSRLEPEPIPGP